MDENPKTDKFYNIYFFLHENYFFLTGEGKHCRSATVSGGHVVMERGWITASLLASNIFRLSCERGMEKRERGRRKDGIVG